MLKKLHLTFSVVLFFFLNISFLKADLLAAYDFDRCILYRLHQQQHGDLEDAIEDSENLFNKRVFKHKSDGLLTTRFANDQHDILAMQASNQIQSWIN